MGASDRPLTFSYAFLPLILWFLLCLVFGPVTDYAGFLGSV